MKDGNQFLTADSKIVLLLILRSNIHSTKEILPSSNPVTELEYSLIESLLLKSTRTNVLQGDTFVNIESQLIESTLLFGKEHYRKEKELKTRYCPLYNFRYQSRAKLSVTDMLN